MITAQEAVEVLGQKFLLQEEIAGVSHNSETLRIYVEDPEIAERIPSTLMGHEVEVVVSGKFVALGALPMAQTGRTLAGVEGSKDEKWRAAPGGVSIGHYTITAGTLGALVYDRFTGARLILSNNHVLAAGNLAVVGDPILQPGPYDGGRDPDDRIGTLERFVELRSPPDANPVDAAVARPVSDADVSDEILDIGYITGVTAPAVGMRVAKSGRTSCYTEGTVEDIHATVKVGGYPGGELIFEDQIITSKIGDPGDSGSLVVDVATKNAVGLLFAGSEALTVVNKIHNVMDALNISVGPVVPAMPSYLYLALSFMPLGIVAAGIGTHELRKLGMI